ncbi:hypothetical protein [Devosia sp. J2-20]|uniref:hypothetical protein n=1 Tax=Devosia sp. J2-20 TaxID=3026161 RepID=UPI0032B77E52
MTKSVADDPARLLKDLIACPSVTPTEAGALDLLEITLKSIGFEVTRLVFEGDGSYPVDNLFATRGTGGAVCCSPDTPTSCPPAIWPTGPPTPSPRAKLTASSMVAVQQT